MKHNHFSAAVPARLRSVLVCALVLCLLAVSFSGCQAADLSDVPETSVPSQASSVSDTTAPSTQPEETQPGSTSGAVEETSVDAPSQVTEPSAEPTSQPTEHVHSYTSQVTAPTCTTDGFTTYTCSCGYSYNSNPTPALGHTWSEWKTDIPATTTQTGQESRKCTVCGETETRIYTCSCGDSYQGDEVPATGHIWGEWTPATPATETTPGTETRTCTVCGETESRNVTIPTTPEDHTHSFTSTVVAPTCTSAGYTLHTCESCSHSYTSDEIPMLAHQWVTDPNGTTHTCSSCGKTETIPGSGSASDPTASTETL